MQFSAILASQHHYEGTSVAEVPDTWLQGRSIYGGLQAALMLRAMRSILPVEAPLRVLQTTFVAPVGAGAFRVSARLLRIGKSAIHVEARAVDGENTAALAVGVFGGSRPSRVRVVPDQPPVAPGEPLDFTYVKGLTPNFLQHFTMRWLAGPLAFSGSREPKAVVQVGLLDEGIAGEEHILAIADAIPPIALSFLDDFAPASSLTWTLEMLTESASELPLRGFRLDAELVAGGDGYTSQSVMLWGPGGEPVALSRQSMVVFG